MCCSLYKFSISPLVFLFLLFLPTVLSLPLLLSRPISLSLLLHSLSCIFSLPFFPILSLWLGIFFLPFIPFSLSLSILPFFQFLFLPSSYRPFYFFLFLSLPLFISLLLSAFLSPSVPFLSSLPFFPILSLWLSFYPLYSFLLLFFPSSSRPFNFFIFLLSLSSFLSYSLPFSPPSFPFLDFLLPFLSHSHPLTIFFLLSILSPFLSPSFLSFNFFSSPPLLDNSISFSSFLSLSSFLSYSMTFSPPSFPFLHFLPPFLSHYLPLTRYLFSPLYSFLPFSLYPSFLSISLPPLFLSPFLFLSFPYSPSLPFPAFHCLTLFLRSLSCISSLSFFPILPFD